MKKEPLHDKYHQLFQGLKQEKMSWDFEDFLEKVEMFEDYKTEKRFKIRRSYQAYLVIVASVLVVFGFVYMYYLKPSSYKVTQQYKMQSITIDGNNEGQLIVDSVRSTEEGSVQQSVKTDKEIQQLMNTILPRKGRLGRNKKYRYASASVLNKNTNVKTDCNAEKYYQNDFVMINGYQVANEKEAIELTEYSLQMVSENILKTLASLSPTENEENDF